MNVYELADELDKALRYLDLTGHPKISIEYSVAQNYAKVFRQLADRIKELDKRHADLMSTYVAYLGIEQKLNDRIAELEKDLELKTRDRDVFRDFTLAYEERIAELEKDLKYFTNPCDPMCKPSICDCYKARFAINNRKTLTDEEITELANQHLSAHAQFIGAGECSYEGEIEFARAILKKASEK